MIRLLLISLAMIIAKLERPSKIKDVNLVLYCSLSVLSEVLSNLSEDELVNTSIELVKVVDND